MLVHFHRVAVFTLLISAMSGQLGLWTPIAFGAGAVFGALLLK